MHSTHMDISLPFLFFPIFIIIPTHTIPLIRIIHIHTHHPTTMHPRPNLSNIA